MTDKTVSLPEERKEERKGGSFLRNNLRNYGMLLSLFAIMLFFEFMTEGTLFRSARCQASSVRSRPC
jgi:putative multiple sugar transport system permease protein